jgi:hypothetical protein
MARKTRIDFASSGRASMSTAESPQDSDGHRDRDQPTRELGTPAVFYPVTYKCYCNGCYGGECAADTSALGCGDKSKRATKYYNTSP